MKKRVLIMGAAGRDFHNFNVHFRDNEDLRCRGVHGDPNPGLSREERTQRNLRVNSTPTVSRSNRNPNFEKLIEEKKIDLVVFAYSDVTNQYVMERSSLVNAAGAELHADGDQVDHGRAQEASDINHGCPHGLRQEPDDQARG